MKSVMKKVSGYFTRGDLLHVRLLRGNDHLSRHDHAHGGVLSRRVAQTPAQGRRSGVKVSSVSGRETVFMFLAAAAVTFGFYFILRYFHTANIVPSTVSVTTSFLAVYLTFRRSPYFNLAYAANDVVLIILWTLASLDESRYISVTVCFAAFLMNDLYGFINWRRIKARQGAALA